MNTNTNIITNDSMPMNLTALLASLIALSIMVGTGVGIFMLVSLALARVPQHMLIGATALAIVIAGMRKL